MMIKLFDNILGLIHKSNTDNNTENNTDDTTEGNNMENNMTGFMEDINELIMIGINTYDCNHDWIDYDNITLDKMRTETSNRNERQLLRIVNNLLVGELNELDSKLLELLVAWIPPSPKVQGKCMICDKEVVVVYISDNCHSIMC